MLPGHGTTVSIEDGFSIFIEDGFSIFIVKFTIHYTIVFEYIFPANEEIITGLKNAAY